MKGSRNSIPSGSSRWDSIHGFCSTKSCFSCRNGQQGQSNLHLQQ